MKRLISIVALTECMLLIGLGALPGPRPAYAAVSFDVNTLNDEAQINPPNGSCTHTVSGLCSLRAAIQATNFQGNNPAGCPCTINLPLVGSYTLTIAGTGENLAATGDLDVAASVTVVNTSGGAITISGNGLDKVFHVQSTGQLTMSQVTITRGNGGGSDGVGMLIDGGGTLVMSNAVIASNAAAGAVAIAGGGFRNNGTATLTNVTIRDNIATSNGGGIRNGGDLTLTNVAVINNQAQGAGGGITLGGTATLTNVTISGNSTTGPAAEGGGLGAFGNATATLTNLTINNNSAPAGTGGGIFARSTATLTLRNTIVANSLSGGNCAGPGLITSAGNNLSSDNTCPFNAPGDLPANTNPLLGALQVNAPNPSIANAGTTETHALLPGSPAIDRVTAGGCPPPATDQRRVLRPQGPLCDIGAFELQVGSTPCILGDINCDGIVDIRDYGLWRQSFGASDCINPADLIVDCIVDIRDYGIWRQHFGEVAPADRRGGPVRAGIAPAPRGTPGPPLLRNDQASAAS